MATVSGPWDLLVQAADAWDQRESYKNPNDRAEMAVVDTLDPLAAMLRRQAARSAMYFYELKAKGVPESIASTVVESDSDFMVAEAAAKGLRTLLS